MSISPSGSKNPFLQHAQQIAKHGANAPVLRPSASKPTATAQAVNGIAAGRPLTGPAPRARLNFIPNEGALSNLIDQALHILRTGRILDRGAVLNLLV